MGRASPIQLLAPRSTATSKTKAPRRAPSTLPRRTAIPASRPAPTPAVARRSAAPALTRLRPRHRGRADRRRSRARVAPIPPRRAPCVARAPLRGRECSAPRTRAIGARPDTSAGGRARSRCGRAAAAPIARGGARALLCAPRSVRRVWGSREINEMAARARARGPIARPRAIRMRPRTRAPHTTTTPPPGPKAHLGAGPENKKKKKPCDFCTWATRVRRPPPART